MFKKIFFSIVLVLLSASLFAQNPTNRQVVLQGFWWDYENDNYPNGWANYLAELAPRLKDLGIDAVWIPPTTKGANQGTGYNCFDQYDLGDKFQKGGVETRMGDKDELLRMVAVLKANGIEVIQDVVLNHMDGAGSRIGQGGKDPEALEGDGTDQFKNFRYSCFTHPESSVVATNYLAREGRFPKNWQNFYPNENNVCCTNDLNSVWWGPDISYEEDAFGESSNATYNPTQASNYMRDNMREWMIWYKKQVGFDGYRLDAVKHYPSAVVEDFLWNIQNNAGFASEGESLFAVGEYIGGGTTLDNWCDAVQNRAGTFDFGLRGEIYNMVTSEGSYNLANIPGGQQSNRLRTVPFINNHDTFRPELSETGNYTGWDSGSELAAHIEPNDPRLAIAYAIILAVDGAPQIFFEDLFDVGYNSKRYSHLPTNETNLPVNDDLLNLLWCHQNLGFKEADYFVPYQSEDLLVIERGAKALICINDSWDNWQDETVQTQFLDGTILKDYSGSTGTAERIVENGGQVYISVPPCNGTAVNGRRGYSIWAPVGIEQNYERPTQSITQAWDMSNDLGDSHPLSLQQGGGLPENSLECRQIGKIFPVEGETVSINIMPTDSTQAITFILVDETCTPIDSMSAMGSFTFEYTPINSAWKTMLLRNADLNNEGQNGIIVEATYTAPKVVDTFVEKELCSCLPQEEDTALERIATTNIQVYPNPSTGIFELTFDAAKIQSPQLLTLVDIQGKTVYQQTILPSTKHISLDVRFLADGVYGLLFGGEVVRVVKY